LQQVKKKRSGDDGSGYLQERTTAATNAQKGAEIFLSVLAAERKLQRGGEERRAAAEDDCSLASFPLSALKT
jgi:hypothetical protein